MDTKVVEILLVEDNLQDAELAIRALKKNNLAHHIHHLRDGAAALEFLFPPHAPSLTNNSLRLILLDLKMPKVNGLEVLRRVKGDVRTRTIPVVVLTSSKQEHDILTAYQAGANSYVVKPVAFDEFSRTVSQFGLYWLSLNQSCR